MLEDETINMNHFSAASNIFEDMLRCQSLPYKARDMVEDEVMWFFLQLERAPVSSDDVLYELSDRARQILGGKTGKEMVGMRRSRSSKASFSPISSGDTSPGSSDSSSCEVPALSSPGHKILTNSDPGVSFRNQSMILALLFFL